MDKTEEHTETKDTKLSEKKTNNDVSDRVRSLMCTFNNCEHQLINTGTFLPFSSIGRAP